MIPTKPTTLPQFAETSFFCFGLENPVRRVAIAITTWKWFERLSILIIIANCVALSLADPCDVKCRKPMCATLEKVEKAIFTFFAIEMVIKMVAMGVFGKKAYLQDLWNGFDCFIVIVGTAELFFLGQENMHVNAIRAIRVLRPLRAINRITSMRILVTLMLDILPMLGNVMIFCCFVFVVFGIVAVQLWAGVFRHRCFFPKEIVDQELVPPFMPPFYTQPHRDYICSPTMGLLHCSEILKFEPHASMCNDMFGSDDTKMLLCQRWVANYTDCRPDGPNPARGTLHFDNIGYAWMTIFQVISLESWSEVMYLVQDSFSYWSWIFFVLLVLMGAYISVNLCLVVIASQFSKTKMREREKIKIERLSIVDSSSRTSLTSINSKEGIYVQCLELVYHYFRVVGRRFCHVKFRPNYLDQLVLSIYMERIVECPACHHNVKTSVETGRQSDSTSTVCRTCQFDFSNMVDSHGNLKHRKKSQVANFFTTTRLAVRQILEHGACLAVIMVTIIANAAVMALEHHNQPHELTIFIEIMNIIFTVIFVLEILIKIYAYGPSTFIREAFNVLDTVIITINIVELFSSGGSDVTGLAVLRLFRMLRLVKIIRFLPGLQRQLRVMVDVVDNVASFFLLFGFFLFVSSLLGMSLFGCKFCEAAVMGSSVNETAQARCRFKILPINISNDTLEANKKPRSVVTDRVYYGCSLINFDTPFQSFFTVLQIFTQDDWGSVMEDGMFYTSQWAGIYFIAIVTIGNYIIFNLLVAILVEGFSSQSDDECESGVLELIRKNTLRRQATDTQHYESTGNVQEAVAQEQESKIVRCFATVRFALWRCWRAEVSPRSLFIFPKSYPPRQALRKLFFSEFYDKAFLLIIIGSCSLVLIDNPEIKKDSFQRRILTIANYAFTAIFSIEALAKIVAFGFCLGRKSYIRSVWNALDFFLLVIAIIDIALEFTKVDASNKKFLQALRILRLLRALRPLRIITRSRGLQVVLQTLVISIKPIGNIILICCFFFLIFAILGVQLFRGCYARCIAPRTTTVSNSSLGSGVQLTESYSEWAMDMLSQVQTKNDCVSLGLQWETDSYNFNSLPEALMALFVFTTLDGWADITRTGVDCVGADKQPVRDYNMWAYAYFIAFLLIVCFFALNMFVGVVVNNFQRVHRELAECFVTKPKKTSTRKKSIVVIDDLAYYAEWRKKLFEFVTSKSFEYSVIGATVLNVVLMGAEFYMMPPFFQRVITLANYGFLSLLICEVFLKVVAFGPYFYASNRWHQIDIVIMILSLVGIALEELPKESIPVNPAIVTFPRVFRIVRVLKLLKSAAGVRKLLQTISEAVPHVLNLSMLFFILFFIYASLGVELYGRFDCTYKVCEGLSRHANFKHLGISLLTLFRIFTGDNWNRILKDVLHMSSDPQLCSSDSREDISCNIVYAVAPVYFISFVLSAQYILINVVVAVLMSQLEEAQNRLEKEHGIDSGIRKGRSSKELEQLQLCRKSSKNMDCASTHSCRSNGGFSLELFDDEVINVNVVSSTENVVFDVDDAASTTSAKYVLPHRQEISDAEFIQFRNSIMDTDSAVVSDMTSPISIFSPCNSPVKSVQRISSNDFTQPTPLWMHRSFEKRPWSTIRSPGSSLDLVDEQTASGLVTASVEVRRTKFTSRLPVLPESPGSSNKDQ